MADNKIRPGILIILDGFGCNPEERMNAVKQAHTPTLDYLFAKYPHTTLDASESHVGLPNGFMGNSEVGHLNMGAGRVVYQDFSLISHAIETGEFFQNHAFLGLFDQMKRVEKKQPTLHLMGLLSDGGVHSHISHVYALLQLAKRNAISKVAIHVITDGRDTSPTSGIEFVRKLQSHIADAGVGKIATVSGRFYAMDRDNRWERVEKAYQAIVAGEAEIAFVDPIDYIQNSYNSNTTDEFVVPAVSRQYSGIEDGDGVIFYNFRADRAREITRAITSSDFAGFTRHHVPTLSGYVCMSPYDEKLNLAAAFTKPKVENTLGEVMAAKHLKQLRIAETEKYAHVTYFFNGGDEKVFDGEKRVLVPSPRDVKTYDLKPEMSAREVTDKLIAELDGGTYAMAVVNYANCDMVGHTGNLRATIKAVEVVDECLARVRDWIEKNGAFAVLTADHGNAEQMEDATGHPLTSHTLLPVPFIVIDPKRTEISLNKGGRLCDIAPTMLELWGISVPKEMTGNSLISSK